MDVRSPPASGRLMHIRSQQQSLPGLWDCVGHEGGTAEPLPPPVQGRRDGGIGDEEGERFINDGVPAGERPRRRHEPPPDQGCE